MQWASSPGRTIVAGIGAILCAIVAGTASYALAVTMIVGASFVAAGTAGAPAGGAAMTGMGAVGLVFVGLAASLAAAVACVGLTRSEAARPRWAPTLLASVVACAAFWSRAIAAARATGEWVTIWLWPTHLESWIWLAVAALVAVNLTAKAREPRPNSA